MRAVVGLAKAMDLDPIAEGVEHPEQARTLVTMGCRLAPGFHYSPAVPAADVQSCSTGADPRRLTRV